MPSNTDKSIVPIVDKSIESVPEQKVICLPNIDSSKEKKGKKYFGMVYT